MSKNVDKPSLLTQELQAMARLVSFVGVPSQPEPETNPQNTEQQFEDCIALIELLTQYVHENQIEVIESRHYLELANLLTANQQIQQQRYDDGGYWGDDLSEGGTTEGRIIEEMD
jgi:hypothetical protein